MPKNSVRGTPEAFVAGASGHSATVDDCQTYTAIRFDRVAWIFIGSFLFEVPQTALYLAFQRFHAVRQGRSILCRIQETRKYAEIGIFESHCPEGRPALGQ